MWFQILVFLLTFIHCFFFLLLLFWGKVWYKCHITSISVFSGTSQMYVLDFGFHAVYWLPIYYLNMFPFSVSLSGKVSISTFVHCVWITEFLSEVLKLWWTSKTSPLEGNCISWVYFIDVCRVDNPARFVALIAK